MENGNSLVISGISDRVKTVFKYRNFNKKYRTDTVANELAKQIYEVYPDIDENGVDEFLYNISILDLDNEDDNEEFEQMKEDRHGDDIVFANIYDEYGNELVVVSNY